MRLVVVMQWFLWVQSKCKPGACFIEDFLVNVSFDDVLITIDKTELV